MPRLPDHVRAGEGRYACANHIDRAATHGSKNTPDYLFCSTQARLFGMMRAHGYAAVASLPQRGLLNGTKRSLTGGGERYCTGKFTGRSHSWLCFFLCYGVLTQKIYHTALLIHHARCFIRVGMLNLLLACSVSAAAVCTQQDSFISLILQPTTVRRCSFCCTFHASSRCGCE